MWRVVNILRRKGAPVDKKKTADERKETLARHVANATARGLRVESQSDYQAVFVNGKPVNHILHLILSAFTLGLWLLVWAALAIFGGEKRSVVRVDEYGNVLAEG